MNEPLDQLQAYYATLSRARRPKPNWPAWLTPVCAVTAAYLFLMVVAASPVPDAFTPSKHRLDRQIFQAGLTEEDPRTSSLTKDRTI